MNPTIEHIGSTAIPNLASKPIFDFMVGIENSNLLNEAIDPMIHKGYIYYESFNSRTSNRRLFIGLKDENINKKKSNLFIPKRMLFLMVKFTNTKQLTYTFGNTKLRNGIDILLLEITSSSTQMFVLNTNNLKNN